MAMPPVHTILLKNVRVFDGRHHRLSAPSNVSICGNKIAAIGAAQDFVAGNRPAEVIDCQGKTLMPGLIDAHVHTMLESIPLQVALHADIGYLNLVAARAAERQLLRGFTTVRDVGGASFGLKRAIDQCLFPGPRIYPSGAMISQTGGHGDFRSPHDIPRDRCAPLTSLERYGMTIIADGPDEVRLRAREQLRQGATQIKLMAGGGVTSTYDPLDVTQYTVAELRSAVEAAENWGTYVTVHAYTSSAVRQAVEAGVRCIEHGQLVDETTARLLAERDIWWSLQPFLDEEPANRYPEGSPHRQKQQAVAAGTDQAYRWARQYGVKTAFGTDVLFDAERAATQGKQLATLSRWYTPAEVLVMATSGNAELLAMCGERNPYPGPLGVVEVGAYADLVLVDGNPLERIELIAEPDKSFVVIIKDGVVHKNVLA